MANDKVMFKRGSQANLAAYINGTTPAAEGTFYLTSDTNRLYVGKNGKAVPVNQGVIAVDSLPTSAEGLEVGQFYYLNGSNVLAINSGGKWVQINPDTDTSIDKRTMSVTAQGTNGVKISDSIELKDNHGNSKGVKTSEFAIAGENGVNITVDDKNNITISQDDYAFTSNYDETTASAKVTLSNGHASSDVAIKAGSNVTLALDKAKNEITINAKDTTMATGSVTLTKNNGTLQVAVSDGTNVKTSEAVTFGIKYGNTEGTRSDATFDANGNFVLDTYTTTELNEKFRNLNGMTYKGTAAGIPEGDHKLGDTYKATDNFTVNGQAVKIGDLIIANGKESVNDKGEDYIKSTDLTWDIIPSGNDSLTDTTYIAKNREHGFDLANATSLQSNGGFALASNAYLTLTDAVTDVKDTNGKLNTVTIAHKEVLNATGTTDTKDSATQTKGAELTFNIPVLGYDKAGHITSVDTKEIKVVDTIHKYGLDDFSVSVASNKATIGTTLASAAAGVVDNKAFSISSSTLTLSGTGTDLVMDIEWGSFDPTT
jgi:hypothetical protein